MWISCGESPIVEYVGQGFVWQRQIEFLQLKLQTQIGSLKVYKDKWKYAKLIFLKHGTTSINNIIQ